jgi:hypothetical protein
VKITLEAVPDDDQAADVDRPINPPATCVDDL